MPMDFPDMDSLRMAADVHKFRQPVDGETEDAYRSALADHVHTIDRVEAAEIRNKVGWDKFTPRQTAEMVFKPFIGTRAEHVRWCKARALAFADKGEATNTVLSMVSDLGKHPETARLSEAASMLGLVLMMRRPAATPETCRKWVTDFAE